MSYLMYVGDTPEAKEIIKSKSFPIKPIHWYDPQGLRYATS